MRLHHFGVGLAVLAGAAACDDVVSMAPAAETPVLDPLVPGDPTGFPSPSGAPFFHSVILKFHVPWPTVIEVAVDGVILKEEPQGCGDRGCYIVLANQENPSGQANYVIQIYPPAHKRRATQIKVIITDVSVNPSLQGAMLAAKPLELILLEAIGGPPNPASLPGTPEYAAYHDGGFLDHDGLSSQQDEIDYRAAVDPTGAISNPAMGTTSFQAWKERNGFHRDKDSLDDARAVYFNGGDLEFGRSMHMKKQANGDIAYYVSNYPTVEDARRGTNLIATVAMDYSAVPPGGPRFTKFYAFKADGSVFPDPDLDGRGNKYLPLLCVTCHGVLRATPPGGTPGDLGARFLPFDLASFQYSTVAGFTRADQEAEFKKLNEGVLETNKSAATEALIDAWYGGPGRPSAMQDSNVVPQDWTGHEPLYLSVIQPLCRSCHITRDAPLDFGSFMSFDAYNTETVLCAIRQMPNAKVPYQRFWLDRSLNAVDALRNAGLMHFSSTGPCPPP